MSNTFRFGNTTFTTPPKVEYSPLFFGENFRGQSGTLYTSINAVNPAITLNFERLTSAEATALKYYCTRTSSSPNINLEMVDRNHIFDGVTHDEIFGRILRKVRIMDWRFTPIVYDDSESIESASISVEEV